MYFLFVALDIVDPYKDIGAEVVLATVPPLNNVRYVFSKFCAEKSSDKSNNPTWNIFSLRCFFRGCYCLARTVAKLDQAILIYRCYIGSNVACLFRQILAFISRSAHE